MSDPKVKPRLCLITLGCKANQYDSYAILGYVAPRFTLVAPDPETPADVYLINTCTVTHKADFDARQWIHRARRWNPRAKIIVTGCLAEANRAELEKEKVDLIAGIGERQKLISELAGTQAAAYENIFYHSAGGLQFRARAMLKIQEGCNYRCSYCIVPYARGKSRSLPAKLALEQMAQFRKQGFEEVVLCGINLAEWGREKGMSLADLIREIEKAGLGMRIRLSSLEPMAIGEELIDTIASSQIICPHLHIPLQSGDDEILAKMKRPYSTKDFNALARKLLERIPGLCLGLDVIVGFPGESEENFGRTRVLLESLPFGYLHIFTFSPRANTPAKKLRPKVPERVSQKRAQILAALNQNRRREFALSQVGRKMEMVVEGREDDWAFGHSGNYLYLKARTGAALRKRVTVELKEVADNLIAQEV